MLSGYKGESGGVDKKAVELTVYCRWWQPCLPSSSLFTMSDR